MRFHTRCVFLMAASALFACSSVLPPSHSSGTSSPGAKTGATPARVEAADRAERAADSARLAHLERLVERMSDDLRHAEESLVLAESGMRGSQTRADAVKALAEARIQVRRAQDRAPWRSEEIADAERKLAEAAAQIEAEHFSAAVFFVYRAQRIAQLLQREGEEVRADPNTRFVEAPRVNLRSGPSTKSSVVRVLEGGLPVVPERWEQPWVLVRVVGGSVGWMHASFLRAD